MSPDPSAAPSESLGHAAAPQAAPDRPWLGLAHFTEADHEYFYGRDAEVRELTERVQRTPLTVLYGVSGYGKSSLLGAGVIPALRAAGHPVVLLRRCYDDLASRPLEDDVIAACVAGVAGSQIHEQPGTLTLWEFFHDRRQPWFGRAEIQDDEIATEAAVSAPWPVLLLDQFEEIFIKGEDRATSDKASNERARNGAREFLTQLADLVENRPPAGLRARIQSGPLEERRALVRRFDFQARPVRVAMAVRDDFLGRLERWRRAMPSLMEHRVEMRLLSGPQAFKAVFEPGTKRVGQPPIIPPEVASAIVRAAAGAGPDVPLEEIDAVPPILSLLCERLNDHRLATIPTPASITAADFSAGEAERILGRFYDDKFRSHPRVLREYLEDELVSVSGFRENVTLDAAFTTLRRQIPDIENRLRQLVDDRVLVIDDRGGIPRVEFTHDTLARLALDRRAERRARARRLKAFVWGVTSTVVAGVSLGLAAWAYSERTRALAAVAEAKKQTQLVGVERNRAVQIFRYMDLQVNEAFVDSVPVQLRERVSARVDEFYKQHADALATFDDHELMGYHMRKALVHFAALDRYEKETYSEVGKARYVTWERDSASAELKEALRLGEALTEESMHDPDRIDRGVTRDLILTHYYFASLSAQLKDSTATMQHLKEARALLDALVQGGPFSRALYMDWMGLPNLDAAVADRTAAAGDKSGAHAWYDKALALQAELVARSPADEHRKTESAHIDAAVAALAAEGGDKLGAHTWYEKAFALQKELADSRPTDQNRKSGLVRIEAAMGDLEADGGDKAAASAWFETALALQAELVTDNPEDQDQTTELVRLDASMGDLAAASGDKAKAHEWYDKAFALQTKLVAARPGNENRKAELERIQKRLQGTAP